MEREMVRVELGRHDVRRYTRKQAERIIRERPGARILEDAGMGGTGGSPLVDVNGKALGSAPEIKAILGPPEAAAQPSPRTGRLTVSPTSTRRQPQRIGTVPAAPRTTTTRRTGQASGDAAPESSDSGAH